MDKIRRFTKNNCLNIIIGIEVIMLGLAVIMKFAVPLENYTIPIMSGSPDIGELYQEGGYYTFDQDGDAAAALELDDYIPFHLSVPVKAGSYTVTIDYKSSSFSQLRLYSPSYGDAVQCDDFMLYENKEQLISNFIVKQDLQDLDIKVKYGGYGYFDIRSITLQGNHKDLLPLATKMVLLFLLIDLLIWCYKRKVTLATSESFRTGFILVSIALLASLPLFVGYLPMMDDGVFCCVRMEGVKDAILEGQIPAIIMPNSLLGYGYADPVFYPNVPLYIAALFRILGFSFMESYKICVFTINLLTAVIAFYAVSKAFHSNRLGLLGSFIYTFSIYRLVDVYRRAALGEYWAIAFMPLIVYGLYLILTADTEEVSYKKSWVPLTIGLWGLTNGHLLSCEMAAVFIVPVCLIFCRRVFQKKRFIQLLKSVVVTLLLWVYFLVPFIDMSLRDSYKVFTSESMNLAENTISLLQTFSLFFSQVGSAVGMTVNYPPRDTGIGFIFLPCILLFVYLKLRYPKSEQESQQEKSWNTFCWVCLVFGCIAIWMTTYYFPWSKIGIIGGIIKKIMFMVQSPGRYTAIATVLLVFVICEVIRILHERSDMRMDMGYLIAGVLIVLVSVQSLYYFQTVPREGETYYYYEEGGMPMSGGNGYGEYEPSEFQGIRMGDNIWILQETFGNVNESIEIKEYNKYATDSVLTVNNLSAEEQKVYLPILYYPGYVAFDIFSETPIQIFKSEKGTLGVLIPAGYMSAVKIEYHISWLYRVGEAISAITLIILIWIWIKKRRNKVCSGMEE